MMDRKDFLLVIDMQNVYRPGEPWGCPNSLAASDNIRWLLERCPHIDAAFTQFLPPEKPLGDWQKYNEVNKEINDDPYMSEVMEELRPFIDITRPLYNKSTYSSLSVPELQEKVKNCRNLILTGVVAECCVLSTALAAIDEGIHVIYLKDAVAGISPETEAATELVLSGLSPSQVEIMTTRMWCQAP